MTDGESGWQLTGSAPENYERYMVPVHCERRAPDLLDRLALRPGETLLDVACGTGIVSRHAARRVGTLGRVIGIDLSPGMLEVARQVCAYVEPRIEFLEGSAEEIPLPDAHVDAVVSQLALMFFPDRAKALAEMRRVLSPGGRIAVRVWRSGEFNPIYANLAIALEKHLGADAAAIMRSPFITGSVDEMRSLFDEAGFDDIRVVIRADTLRFASVSELVRQEIASMPVPEVQAEMLAAREAITREMTERLEAYVDDDGVFCPVQDYITTARR